MNNDIFKYIADNNPDGCIDICSRYGWTVQEADDLPLCMKQIVADSGQKSFTEFIELHPDKEVIVDVFGNKKECKDCIGNFKNFLNANGGGATSTANQATTTAHANIANQTQLMLIGSIVIISLALILNPSK